MQPIILLNDGALEASPIVANNRMNRERGLHGNNSYTKDIGLDPYQFLTERLRTRERVAWLDLCCGTGTALIEAAIRFEAEEQAERMSIHGVDLVSAYAPMPRAFSCLRLETASLADWTSPSAFDLITCVHGLHYIGDKLGLIQRAVSWLKPDGLFVAHLDYGNLRLADGKSAPTVIGKVLRNAGFSYRANKRLLICEGQKTLTLPYRYLGADDEAGPNYTGQPAVNSHYDRLYPAETQYPSETQYP